MLLLSDGASAAIASATITDYQLHDWTCALGAIRQSPADFLTGVQAAERDDALSVNLS